MGSWGEIKASKYINKTMGLIGLEDNHTELIDGSKLTEGYGKNLQYIDDRLEILDYGLTINLKDGKRDISKDEIFPFASAYGGYEYPPEDTQYNFSGKNLKVIPINISNINETIMGLLPVLKHPINYTCIARIPNPQELYNTTFPGWGCSKNILEKLGVWEIAKSYLEKVYFKIGISDPEHMDIVSFFFLLNGWLYLLRILNTITPSTCKALILYDSVNETHFMFPSIRYWAGVETKKDERDYKTKKGYPSLPILSINGSLGKTITKDSSFHSTLTIDFYLIQTYGKITSYNVIGNITDSNNDKTIIIGNHYDSWWGECAGDSAVSDGIMLAIAKYFIDHHLTPPYNLTFIAFGGEEYLDRGSVYYERIHNDTKYSYMICLDQLGYEQKYPPVYMELYSNDKSTLSIIEHIAKESGYSKRTGHGIKTVEGGAPSDDAAFNVDWRDCITVCLSKDRNWTLYHRSGSNHNEGDVLTRINDTNLRAAADLALNITYGLLYMRTVWEPTGIIPFIIAIALIIIAVIIIWRKRGMDRRDRNNY